MRQHWARERARLFQASPARVPVGRGAGRCRRAGGQQEHSERRKRQSRWLAVLVGCLLAALMLAALRLSILRTRYRLAELAAEETRLLAAERDAAVAWRELRDPDRLRELAQKQGFGPPTVRIQLARRAVSVARPQR